MLLAIFAVTTVASGCGGSTDHSSEWSSAESSALEEKLAGEISVFTSAGISCYAKGIEAAFPPSEAGGESANSDSGKKTLEGIVNKCAESSANVQGILSQACKEEGILGANCLSEVTSQTEEEFGSGSEEEYGYPEESYGEEGEVEENPEALEELDEERKQEIEQEEAEGLVTPESSNP